MPQNAQIGTAADPGTRYGGPVASGIHKMSRLLSDDNLIALYLLHNGTGARLYLKTRPGTE